MRTDLKTAIPLAWKIAKRGQFSADNFQVRTAWPQKRSLTSNIQGFVRFLPVATGFDLETPEIRRPDIERFPAGLYLSQLRSPGLLFTIEVLDFQF